jgi:hypothetical protein
MLFPTLAKSAVSQVKILFTLSLAVFTAATGKVQIPRIGPICKPLLAAYSRLQTVKTCERCCRRLRDSVGQDVLCDLGC